MLFEKLNRQTKLFNVDIENPEFRKLSTFNDGQILRVDGMYINKKSVYGEEPIFIVFDGSKHYFVNMPKQHLETIDTVIHTSEMVDGINGGECYIQVVGYYSKRFNKQCFDIQFIAKPTNSFNSKPVNNNGFSSGNGLEPQEDIF